jgi:CHASE3 domain sensor protein
MKSVFKRNLLIGFGVSLLLLIVSSVASYISIRNLLESMQLVQHTNTVIRKLENSISVLKDAETGQRGFLLTGEERFLDPYKGAYELALNEVNDIKRLTGDNPAQQKNAEILAENIKQRLSQLARLIDLKRANIPITNDELSKGKGYMDDARALVKAMAETETTLLSARIDKLNKLAGNTPLLILVAAAMAILITIVFFIRINADFNKRLELQQELEQKEKEIKTRIGVIQAIAEKIAAGDYTIRTQDETQDDLGGLAISLNKMAESLDYSFGVLSDK